MGIVERSFSPQEFLEVIEDLLRAIAEKRGAGVGARSLYEPLRATMFSRRKSKYFPGPLEELPVQVMPKELFDGVRAALAQARDALHEPCLSVDQLSFLDEAWGAYCRGCLRTSANVPKRWHILVKGKSKDQFSTPERFMEFIYEGFYRNMIRGEFRECDRNIQAILAAFIRGDSLFPNDEAVKRKQEALLLASAHFCMIRMSDPRQHHLVDRMKRLQKNDEDSILLEGILAHQHFNEFTLDSASQQLRMVLDGKFQGWGNTFNGGSAYVRAADVCIKSGMGLKDKPDCLHGFSVEEAALIGVGMYESIGRSAEALQCETVRLFGLASDGREEEAFNGVDRLRKLNGTNGDWSPCLEMHTLIVEARAYHQISRDRDKRLLRAARDKLTLLRALQKQHPRQSINVGNIRYIEKLNAVLLDKCGFESNVML